MSTKISQKDYLKKYWSGNKKDEKKKKKKRPKVAGQGMKIIDDDVDVTKIQLLDEDIIDIYGYSEDAPQIVGIIDERPDEIKKMEEFTQTSKWKLINEDSGFNSSITVEQISKKIKAPKIFGESSPKSDSDLSPPRGNENSDSDLSPERSHSKNNSNSLKNEKSKKIKQEKRNDDSDLSPPRTTKYHSEDKWGKKHNEQYNSKQIKTETYDSDLSPPRKRKNYSDISPLRTTKYKQSHKNEANNSDLSPDRERTKNDAYLRKYRGDNSKSKRDNREATVRDRKNIKRKSRWDTNEEKNDMRSHNFDDLPYRRSSRSRERMTSHDNVNNRNTNRLQEHNRNNYDKKNNGESSKVTTTLEGKKAGLQNAQQLRIENEEFKRNEDFLFEQLSEEYTGKNAQTIKRDLKSGRPKDTEAELAKQKEREEKQKEMDAKYNKWGKGLKQVEAQEAKVKEYLHEAAKPLARYKNDKDLDQILKEQERIGDPMLEYMRKKDKERDTKEAEVYPIYYGPYPPNRFNIRPGHRWDGVDRSSGYEKSYFDAKSSKIAQDEETYKWSTEDM